MTPAIRATHPDLRALWVEDKTATLLRTLAAGELDAALVALEAELGDVEHEVVASDPFVLATRDDDPLGASRAPLSPRELRHAEVLLLDDGHCFRDQVLKLCATAKARELEFRATSIATLAQMVAGGAGVTLLPQLAVATEAQRAGLRVRAFVAPAPHRTVALVWRKRSPLKEALKTLAATIRGAYPSPAKRRATSPGAHAPRR